MRLDYFIFESVQMNSISEVWLNFFYLQFKVLVLLELNGELFLELSLGVVCDQGLTMWSDGLSLE